MKVKVTVTGTLDIDREDLKDLERASPGELLDSIRHESTDKVGSVERVGKSHSKRAKTATTSPEKPVETDEGSEQRNSSGA